MDNMNIISAKIIEKQIELKLLDYLYKKEVINEDIYNHITRKLFIDIENEKDLKDTDLGLLQYLKG